MNRLRILVALLAIFLAACGTQTPDEVDASPTPETPEASPSPTPGASPLSGIMPNEPAASPTEGKVLYGWPEIRENLPGVYSWNGSLCKNSCNMGFIHNGYGSGDIDIHLRVVPDGLPSSPGGTAVTVAGHDAIYQSHNPPESWLRESWLVDIEGTTIFIELQAQPGTSQSDLADAHAIIGSLRTDPLDKNDRGFRLAFELTTDDWDSG